MDVIAEFRGEFRFLSNFYPATIVFRVGGLDYAARTVEHAFQALKAEHVDELHWVLEARTPGEAKRRGRTVTMRAGWDRVRVEAMERLLELKFAPDSSLAASLLDTAPAELVEGNTWGDTFWGVCDGVGENHLGRLLMARRAALAG